MYLYGASGHAKVITEILESSGKAVAGLFDDHAVGSEFFGKKLLGKYSGEALDAPLLISIGNNCIRARIAEKLQLSFGQAIDPSAIISSSISIQQSTVAMQGSIVQAGVSVGEYAIINTGASKDHDCIIHSFTNISPGAVLSGNVKVGEGAFIGSGAIILPGIRIGKWGTIGARAVVNKDIPDNCTAVGNPARIIKGMI